MKNEDTQSVKVSYKVEEQVGTQVCNVGTYRTGVFFGVPVPTRVAEPEPAFFGPPGAGAREIATAPAQSFKNGFLTVESMQNVNQVESMQEDVESMKTDAYFWPKETTADPYMKPAPEP